MATAKYSIVLVRRAPGATPNAAFVARRRAETKKPAMAVPATAAWTYAGLRLPATPKRDPCARPSHAPVSTTDASVSTSEAAKSSERGWAQHKGSDVPKQSKTKKNLKIHSYLSSQCRSPAPLWRRLEEAEESQEGSQHTPRGFARGSRMASRIEQQRRGWRCLAKDKKS